MNAAARFRATDLNGRDIPVQPGVYAWYRRGRAVYIGMADDLHDRIWKRHLGQSRTLATSAFRRNVAQHLGFGEPADIKAGRIVLALDQLSEVREWILGCRVAWAVCRSIDEAKGAEIDLKTEWLPPLTKL